MTIRFLLLLALSQVIKKGQEPGKVRCRTNDHEVCVKLVQKQDFLQAEDGDHKEEIIFHNSSIFFDDVKDEKFLDKITEGFDDGEVYETSEGEFVRQTEVVFRANYFGMDEVNTTVDGERVLDRISAIPFSEWDDIPAEEFAMKQTRFKQVVDSPEKPTEFLIGDIGMFIKSAEFKAKKVKFGRLLFNMCEGCVKIRTLGTNYGAFYAIMWKIHEVFQDVWTEMDESLSLSSNILRKITQGIPSEGMSLRY